MDSAQVDRLADLIRPLPVRDLVTTICVWLQDAHEAAAELQPARRNNHRGNWHNNTSFGTDRHQYLRNTAGSLSATLPDLQVDADFQVVLLRLARAAIYQFHHQQGPLGALGDASDLRKELLTTTEPHALFSRRDALVGDRAMLLLPWKGTEEAGLTDAWIGQGELVDNHIEWDWYVRLQDLDGRPAVPAAPLRPDVFDAPQPELPLRPRPERDTRSS